MTKAMSCEKRRDMPAYPVSLRNMGVVPERGEQFVMYDSFNESNKDDDDSDVDSEAGFEEEEEATRIIVFGTVRNIKLLCRNPLWFLDGTFKTSPTIFTELFTVMGLRTRTGHPDNEAIAVPFVYALLSHKKEFQYKAVINVVMNARFWYYIANYKSRN